jgi:hypothetical protein
MDVWQGVAGSGHGLPEVSPGPAMPYPSGAAQLQGTQPAALFYPFGHPTPYTYVPKPHEDN